MAGDNSGDWSGLGVRADAVEAWQALGMDAFDAALAQGDGYGPTSARHYRSQLLAVAQTWRAAGLGDADGLAWHRAGFGAAEAVRWRARGMGLDTAALAAGRRMRG